MLFRFVMNTTSQLVMLLKTYLQKVFFISLWNRYLKASQTSKAECFAKVFNGRKLFFQISIIDVRQGSQYGFGSG